MLWRSVAVAAAAALAAVIWTGTAKADGDTMRLGLDVGAPTMTLGGNTDADTVDVHWRRFGYYRPSYYYGYSYYRPSYSYGYSYYPRYSYSYGYSYYRPSYYYGYSHYPRSYGYSYYPRYYGYSYYPRYYYYGIGLNDACGAETLTLPGRSDTAVAPEVRPPANPPAVRDGTFPYDGGPDRPVPMPKVEDEPEGTRIPPKTTPRIEGIPVSIPAKTKYVYPAYGENLRR